MNIIQYLRNDEELKALRLKWKEVFGAPFPPYNYDEYNGVEEYKSCIRKELAEKEKQK